MTIVISSDLYAFAQQGLAVPLTHARIMYDSHTLDPATEVTGSTESAGFEADSVLNPDTYSRWLATADPSTLTFDLGSAKPTDYVFIAGHNFAAANITVTVESSADGIVWTPVLPDRQFSSNLPAAFLFASQTVRYWRIVCAGGVPRIAVVYLGVALAMQRPIYGGHSPAPLSRITDNRPTKSEGGQFLGHSVTSRGYAANYSWNNLQAAWYRQFFDPFVKAARLRPFGIAWRPSTFPDEVVYARTSDDIRPSNTGTRDLMSVSLSARAFDEEDT